MSASNPAPIQTLPPASNGATVDEIARFFDKHGDVWRLAYDNEIERWNQYFPLRRREAWALQEIQNEPKGLAVDLGCGTGHALIKMHQLGFERIMGIDISDDMLSAASRLADDNNLHDVIELHKADVQNITQLADNSVDVCTALGVIEYLDADAPLLAEVQRILRPGGIAVIQTRNYPCMFIRTRKFLRKLRSHKDHKIKHREHTPSQFRRAARDAGLKVDCQRFIHFYALFPLTSWSPLRRLLSPVEHWLSKQCERVGSWNLAQFFASMHVLKLRKPS